MKLLVIDHHFEHDITALRQAAGDEIEIVVISAFYFRNRAAQHLPDEVTLGPLEAYWDERHSAARERADRSCSKALDELLALEHFDAVVAPSDTFFYIRPVVRRAQQLDLPFIVVQKETTIAPSTMLEHSERIGKTFPFCSDRMFVCSERQRDFWLRAGADPELIDVLGQPRFDFYASPAQQPHAGASSGVPRVLYLSYMLNAYARPDQFDADAPAWERLRSDSEDALVSAAVAGRLELMVKPHPQQRDIASLALRLQGLSGRSWGTSVRLVDAAADVRPLIAESDVVVGFQTTALIEALAAGKRPVYTQWSDEVIAQRGRLIPFHDHPDLFACVDAPERLVEAALAGPTTINPPGRAAFVLEHLGRVDGCSSRRVLDSIELLVAERSSLERFNIGNSASARRYRRLARFRALSRVVLGSAVVGVVGLLGVVGLRRPWPGIRDRLELDRRRLAECSGRRPLGRPLVGEPATGVISQLGGAVRQRARVSWPR